MNIIQTLGLDNPGKKENIVLNLTHSDLDGAVSGIVVKNVFPNAVTVKTNYAGSGDYNAACDAITGLSYEAIIFTDFCPDDNMVQLIHSVNKPYLVIDHHQTAKVRDDDELGVYIVDTGLCGALLSLRYFSNFTYLNHLTTLCEVTNDHDLWIRKMLPISDNLNTLLYELGYNEFMEKFMSGIDGYNLPSDVHKILDKHDKEVDEYMLRCEQHKLPYNGYYIETDKFNSDIVIRLMEHYDWLVLAGSEGCSPETTKLSFRTNRNDVNIGQYLKELGRGGGGHPKAAGQLIPTDEKDEFIKQLAEDLFGSQDIV
jgi:oligoribonuclease NrnB/cAMP/cGMP phosphodiesterase (DHH superfamily)